MGLNKDVCVDCVNAHRNASEMAFSIQEQEMPWDSQDEERWRDGTVMCFNAGGASTLGEPPRWCKYAEDHSRRKAHRITREICEQCERFRYKRGSMESPCIVKLKIDLWLVDEDDKEHYIDPPDDCPYIVEQIMSETED